MREIAKFSGAHVTGLNNNEYQVKRANYLASKTGLDKLCHVVKVYNNKTICILIMCVHERVILRICHLKMNLLMLLMLSKLLVMQGIAICC